MNRVIDFVCIMRPSLVARIKCWTRPSVPCLRFSRNGKAVEASNLLKIYHWTRVTWEPNLMF